MERGWILLIAALMVSVAPDVQGTGHLSFADDATVNITRAECGTSKLCVEEPDDCDPAGTTSCLFTSVVVSNMSHLSVELSGESAGFIAMGLSPSPNATEGTSMLFICAQNSSDNGTIFFRTMTRNNTNQELTDSETGVTEIRGTVKDDMIQCEFDIPDVSSSPRSSHEGHSLLFSILLGTGSVDGGTVGPLNVSRTTGLLNLTNPDGNVTTTPPPTGNGCSGAAQLHAVLLLLSVLVLSVTLRA